MQVGQNSTVKWLCHISPVGVWITLVWCVAANSQQSSSDSLKLSNCFCHTAFVISKASHWPLLVRKNQQTSETTWPHMTMQTSPMHPILGALWQPRWVDGTWLNPCYKSSHITALLEQSYQILKQSVSFSHTLQLEIVNCEYHFTRLQIDFLKQFEYFVQWVWKMNHFCLLLSTSMSNFYQDLTLVHSSKPSLEKPGGVRNTQVTLGMLGSSTLLGGTNMISIYIYICTRDFIHIYSYTYEMCVYNLYRIQNEKTGNWPNRSKLT